MSHAQSHCSVLNVCFPTRTECTSYYYLLLNLSGQTHTAPAAFGHRGAAAGLFTQSLPRGTVPIGQMHPVLAGFGIIGGRHASVLTHSLPRSTVPAGQTHVVPAAFAIIGALHVIARTQSRPFGKVP